MARHGYLREYDEAPDRSDNRDDWSDRNPRFMLDQNRNRDENRSSSGFPGAEGPFLPGEEQGRYRDQGRKHGSGSFQSDFSRSARDQDGLGGGDWERSPRNFRSHQDDHYLSWRDQQIRALDEDYADYCREREEQFHSDFDKWRRSRQQSGSQNNPIGKEEELELTQERALPQEGYPPSPVEEATLGTNNSENTGRGRR